jgi:hypothetical protein
MLKKIGLIGLLMLGATPCFAGYFHDDDGNTYYSRSTLNGGYAVDDGSGNEDHYSSMIGW